MNLDYSANKFKDISVSSFIEAGLNIVISVLLVRKLGLIGVTFGTIVGMTYRTVFYVYFTSKLIPRPQWIFYRKIFLFSTIAVLGFVLCSKLLPLIDISIVSWITHAVIYSVIIMGMYLFLSLIFFKNELKFFKKILDEIRSEVMNIAIIFAGGVGSRMHSKDKPKQFLEIYKKPIIIHTLEYFENHSMIDAIAVVCVELWIPYLNELLYKFRIDKVKKVVPGGDTGQLSIYNGLNAAKEIAGDEKSIVLIHDGVRPLITEKLISENIEAVKRYGNSITSGIVKETIVEIDDNSDIKLVPDRAHSRVAKAPQCFYLNDILDSHNKALSEGITNFIDSCTMMKYYGFKLHMTDGPYENIKITTPDDFYTMRAILEAKENAQIYGMDE